MALLTLTLAQWQVYTYIFKQLVGYVSDLNAVNGMSDEDCDKYMAEERATKKEQRTELDNL